jgi:transcriptional regulator with XRE-family HTH domain
MFLLRLRNRLRTLHRMSGKPSPWYRRLLALAELAGDQTQQDIAQTLGVSKSAVTGWKEGTAPRPEQVKAAATAYGVDALELLRIAYLDSDDGHNSKWRPPSQDPNKPPL